jgi:hypothetical protein
MDRDGKNTKLCSPATWSMSEPVSDLTPRIEFLAPMSPRFHPRFDQKSGGYLAPSACQFPIATAETLRI